MPLLVPIAIHHDDVPARSRSQCHEVAPHHDSELVLARQPERLSGLDDVQRPLRRPVELQDRPADESSTSTTMWLTTIEVVVEVTVRDHEGVAVTRDPADPGVLEPSGEV